jgi:hypothetical protein
VTVRTSDCNSRDDRERFRFAMACVETAESVLDDGRAESDPFPRVWRCLLASGQPMRSVAAGFE